MLEYLRKRQREAKAQEVGTEQTVGPAGMSNQAMISMLESQREQPAARPASGGTPLADAMRAKFERQFGLPMDDVRVHHNSDEPAKFDAGAYTYGTDIFIGPGQEELLNHEMTHVAQQKLGQVRPTGMENGLAVNRSPALEHSADTGAVTQTMGTAAGPVVQCGPPRKRANTWPGPKVKAEPQTMGTAAGPVVQRGKTGKSKKTQQNRSESVPMLPRKSFNGKTNPQHRRNSVAVTPVEKAKGHPLINFLGKTPQQEVPKLSLSSIICRSTSPGWDYILTPPGDIHIKEKDGKKLKNRIRIDAANTSKKEGQHMHFYDTHMKPIDINGHRVKKDSPMAHIPYTVNDVRIFVDEQKIAERMGQIRLREKRRRKSFTQRPQKILCNRQETSG